MKKSPWLKSGIVFLVFNIFITMFSGTSLLTTKASAAEAIPQVAIASLDHHPFVKGDRNSFFISTKNYTGKVQYQLFYTSKGIMGDKWELINNAQTTNGWTGAFDAKEPIEFDITSLNLKEEYYRFAIRVKRVGVKGKYSNAYGDYDSAYPFTSSVVKSVPSSLNGDMQIDKTVYTQSDKLNITGVTGAIDTTKYKLHLYDVKNNKWLENLTDYSSNISYSLRNLAPGPYIVDIWAKDDKSNAKYDGWKLKAINIVEEEYPKIGMVSLDHSPFVEGDNNKFFITSKEYSGQVQYQLFYTCKTTMGNNWKLIENEDTIEGWTKSVDAKEVITFDISKLNMKADYYRFAIRVKRVGVEGRFSNQYGSYDYAHPFTFNVVKSTGVHLKDDMIIDKVEYANNDNLLISGVNNVSNAQYKLHLYDVTNNVWLTGLTDYRDKIDYDLSSIKPGVYVVDIWGKNPKSSAQYDAWKLKVINVNSEMKKITSLENLTANVFKGDSYTLPQSIKATFEDGTTANKQVIWNGTVNTSKTGVFSFEGTVKGYEGKAELELTVVEGRGNSAGNIMNLGIVVEKDEWIYYLSDNDDGKLYKVKKDGSNRTKVSDDNGMYLNIVGDFLYYCNLSDDGKLYKIKIDGTERTKLSDDVAEQIIVDKYWIYYTNSSDESINLYKIKTDGTSRTKLNSDITLNPNLENGYIYYVNALDSKIYKVKTDGSGRAKVSDEITGFISVDNGWIYYSNAEDAKIYKIKTNGTGKVAMMGQSGMFLNVQNGWLYYTDLETEGHLYKMNLAGTTKAAVISHGAVFYSIIGDNIYYANTEDEFKLYKTTITGGEDTVLEAIEVVEETQEN